MSEQMDLFNNRHSNLVPVGSERFLRRLAAVLVRETGCTRLDAYAKAERAVEGYSCPHCGSTVKLYPRPIHRGMIRVLVNLCERFEAGSVFTTKDILSKGGDYAKLAQFGLMSKGPSPATWKLTEAAHRFVQGAIPVPKVGYWFLGEFVAYSTAMYRFSGDSKEVEVFNQDRLDALGVEQVYLSWSDWNETSTV